MRLAGQLAALVLVLVVVACAPRAPLAGKAHSAMGGGSGCPPPSQDPSTITVRFTLSSGSWGSFANLKGAGIDSTGRLFVPDGNNNNIQVFNAATGSPITTLTSANGQSYTNPRYVVEGPSGQIYISDRGNDRFVVLDSALNFLFQSPSGQFTGIEGIAVDNNGDIYALDGSNYNIKRFDPNGQNPVVVVSGISISTDHLVLHPGRNELLINDAANDVVLRYDKTTGAALGSISGLTAAPQGLAVDRNGRLYVGLENALVSIFDDTYAYLHSFTAAGMTAGATDGLAYSGAADAFAIINDAAGAMRAIVLDGGDVESLTWCPCADGDGDGYFPGASCTPGGDCNDNNPSVFPGAPETCNNIDDDCDTQTDDGLTQSQTCGVGACQQTVGQTCTAGAWLPACTPGAPSTELCGNSLDDDCDGSTDEAGCCVGGAETCNNADDDCDGQIDDGLTQSQSCGTGACQQTVSQTCTAGAWLPACTPGTPVPETCNNLDDDCDADTDEGLTQSEKCGVGECQRTVSQTCSAGAWIPPCAPGSPTPEICGNGLDEDCSGADLGCPPGCTTDGDNDGYRSEAACAPNQDCDDANAAVHPGALEQCGNSVDDNCNGQTDEAGCCPATPEACDNADNDCDGQIDDGLTQTQACGVGACQVTVTQTCAAGAWLPACTPGGPGSETCGNGVDEDCDGSDLPCPPSGGSPLFSKGGRGGGGGGGGAGLLRERTTTLEFDADLYKAQFVYLATRPLDAGVTKATVPAPPRRIRGPAFNLSTSRVSDFRSVTVFMRVPLDWLAEEDINRSTLRIERYNVTWTALPTNEFAAPGAPDVPCTGVLCAIGKAFFRLLLPDEYAYFSAAASQPGIFAVTGLQSSRLPPPPTEDLPAPVPPPEKPPVAGPAIETPTDPLTDEEVQSYQNYYILTGLVAVAVVAFLLVLLLRHVHRKATGAGDVPGTSLLALTEWITKCRAAGFTDPQIRGKLSSVGWLDELLDHYLSH